VRLAGLLNHGAGGLKKNTWSSGTDAGRRKKRKSEGRSTSFWGMARAGKKKTGELYKKGDLTRHGAIP